MITKLGLWMVLLTLARTTEIRNATWKEFDLNSNSAVWRIPRERMKMELMASLLHKPEIIFLDEPTIGLDLVAQENIRKFIKSYHHQNNCTIILTSHYMADIQSLCRELVLIFNGEKKYDGGIRKFENILGKD